MCIRDRRSIDEIAAFLPAVYQGGNGFAIDGEKYAVWYSEDGIRIAQGCLLYTSRCV